MDTFKDLSEMRY